MSAHHIAVEEAARMVLATWRASPHAVIRLDLKHALQALAHAVEGVETAQAIANASARRIDHEAWAKAMNGHDHG